MAVTRSKQFESLRAGISSLLPEKPTKQPSLPEEPEDSPKPDTEQEEGAKGEEAAAAKQAPPKTTTAAAAAAATATPVGTATFGSGIVRIWQSLSSQSAPQVRFSSINRVLCDLLHLYSNQSINRRCLYSNRMKLGRRASSRGRPSRRPSRTSAASPSSRSWWTAAQGPPPRGGASSRGAASAAPRSGKTQKAQKGCFQI